MIKAHLTIITQPIAFEPDMQFLFQLVQQKARLHRYRAADALD